jgi:hypothetical protein
MRGIGPLSSAASASFARCADKSRSAARELARSATCGSPFVQFSYACAAAIGSLASDSRAALARHSSSISVSMCSSIGGVGYWNFGPSGPGRQM